MIINPNVPPQGGVTSFHGRSGAVQPAQGDYTPDMVGALAAGGTAVAAKALEGVLPIASGGTGKTTAPLGLYALISGSSALASSALADADQVPVGDVSAATGKKVTLANLKAFLGGGLPVKVNILQTICENITFDDSHPTYTLPSAISLDSSALYYMKQQYYAANGNLDLVNGDSTFSRVTTDSTSYVRWLTAAENNSVTLTTTTVSNTWRGSGKKAVISIYKVSLEITDQVSLDAMNQEGYLAIASGNLSHAEGNQTAASGNNSHAEGYMASASGSGSHAEGFSTKAQRIGSHAEGQGTTASGDYSHAEGCNTTASGNFSHAGGSNCSVSGMFGFVHGFNSIISGYESNAIGESLVDNGTSMQGGLIIGKYNTIPSGSLTNSFIVGYGNNESQRKNVFRLDAFNAYCAGNYNSSGADYAELFEWADGNPDRSDRVGRFVTLDGEKIRLAGPDDGFILGIVSGAPSVVGGVYDDQWQGMFLTDIFGRPVMEDAEVPAELGPGGEVLLPARTERRQKVNPAYDNGEKYLPRSQRPEWDAVGMLGKLVAVDDGTCEVNGWCRAGEGGIATASAVRTRYRVMARLDECHIRVLIL